MQNLHSRTAFKIPGDFLHNLVQEKRAVGWSLISTIMPVQAVFCHLSISCCSLSANHNLGLRGLLEYYEMAGETVVAGVKGSKLYVGLFAQVQVSLCPAFTTSNVT